MATEHEAAIRSLVESFREPYLGLDLGSAQALQHLEVSGSKVRLMLQLGFPAGRYGVELAAAIREQVLALGWVSEADIDVQWRVESQAVQRNLARIQGIRNIVAVASGKGGVGKSTTAANLALGLAFDGAAVGLLDADIYGPSQPRMMGLGGQRPVSPDQKSMIAPEAFGVKVMSIGFLIDEEQPMVWRGPMVTQALVQLLETTRWGDLDYLIVDMPPGTGDTQLTLSQRVPVSGAVIVTTPQDIALLDARKGLRMFQKVEVPVLGIVENMSTHRCSSCGHEEHIFGAVAVVAWLNNTGWTCSPNYRWISVSANRWTAGAPRSSPNLTARWVARTSTWRVAPLPNWRVHRWRPRPPSRQSK